MFESGDEDNIECGPWGDDPATDLPENYPEINVIPRVDPAFLPQSEVDTTPLSDSNVFSEYARIITDDVLSDNLEVVSDEVHKLCTESIAAQLRKTAERPPEDLRNSSDYYMHSDVMLKMFADAVRTNDTAAIGVCREIVDSWPVFGQKTEIDITFIKAISGDTEALASIHGKLQAGHDQQLVRTMELKEGLARPTFSDTHRTNDALTEIVSRCVALGTDATPWIEQYQTNAEDGWGKTAYYLRLQIAAASVSEKPHLQEAYDNHAARLTDMPPDYLYKHAPRILEETADPTIRNQLADGFWSALSHAPTNIESYGSLLHMGRVVMDDPALATDDRYRQFVHAFNKATPDIMRDNSSMTYICMTPPFLEASWFRNGKDPSYIINSIDAVAGAAYKGSDADSTTVSSLRQDWLNSSALRFASNGDFESARQTISAMGFGSKQRQAFGHCLRIATDMDQIAHLALDEATAAVDPTLSMHHEVAALRISGDTDELAARALSHIGSLVPEKHDTSYIPIDSGWLAQNIFHGEYAMAAFEAIQQIDQAQALTVARQMLATLRAQGKPPAACRELSKILIEMNDSDEIIAAYDHIMTYPATDSSARPYDLWELTQSLRQGRNDIR
jgi:hypothetical protein